MLREKTDSAAAFASDFHKYGVDVSPDGTLTVVDPATGAELSGPDAVHKIVDDKRLIAIFQRAGRHSHAFKVAQVKIAKSHYWPAEDQFTVVLDGRTITGRVSDVIHTEAGMATLFDRKVNRGSCAPIGDVVAKIMHDNSLTDIKDAAAYEADIIKALKYRGDYLTDATLTRPGGSADSSNSSVDDAQNAAGGSGSKKGKKSGSSE